MKIAVFGASGGTGQQVVTLAGQVRASGRFAMKPGVFSTGSRNS
jgi:uncharacterized protein YbjT (DUF2867 family)